MTLEQLNQELAALRQEMEQAQKLRTQKADLEQQLRECRDRRQAAAQVLAKEQEDVDRLEGMSLAYVFHTVLGNRVEKLDQERREALAALLRIGDDSFTPGAINDTITGCGVAAECMETGVGRVQVRFPGVVGVPAQIDRLKRIIQEIVPPQVEIAWFYRFLTWAELEEQFPSWAALEEAELSWSQLEMHVLP